MNNVIDGRMFLDHDGSDTASFRSGSNEKTVNIRMKNVTDAISKTMYYM